ncbi:uncharacterized protein EV420DRAFT_1633502 [Desarmillaria tabescens]|uniref:Uncharacterized protein n=1 Tax=Armillaria tabescens TaxID=1929756 RepID=A0AA39NP51_ARMTA|nr:uncharacterized protein EV420DRAFT_1633502 [Desarmillaria tabescens]KAK0469069.1 hypothetical protein EV420DRAFT_1633502 [Desarmillaria tabescens]
MQNSLLSRGEDPLRLLHYHLNVQMISPSSLDPTNLPATIDMKALSENNLPTHVLVLFPPRRPPVLIPIDADRYTHGFRAELVLPLSTRAAPYRSASNELRITLPLTPPLTIVPHPPSLSLLLLFGMGLETCQNDLAYRMLPASVVDEFPNAAAMAQVMSLSGDEEFDRRVQFNMGLWRNILGLGIRDTRIAELVRTAVGVTSEARKLRARG